MRGEGASSERQGFCYRGRYGEAAETSREKVQHSDLEEVSFP